MLPSWSILRGRRLRPPDPDFILAPGDRVNLLIPAPDGPVRARVLARKMASPTAAKAVGPASHGSVRHRVDSYGHRVYMSHYEVPG